MTDLEISKALALAIGWPRADLLVDRDGVLLCFVIQQESAGFATWRHKPFDYRDWNVIGPIAEKYDCFPVRSMVDDWRVLGTDATADSPQRAIALAVIGVVT